MQFFSVIFLPWLSLYGCVFFIYSILPATENIMPLYSHKSVWVSLVLQRVNNLWLRLTEITYQHIISINFNKNLFDPFFFTIGLTQYIILFSLESNDYRQLHLCI